MNKTLLFVLLLLLGFCLACDSPSPAELASDKAAVTKLAILALLPADTAFKNERTKDIQDSREMLNYGSKTSAEKGLMKRRLDSIARKLDTAKILVEIADTLHETDPRHLKSKLANSIGNPHSYYTGLEKWESDVNIISDQKLLDANGLPTGTGFQFSIKRILDRPSRDWFNAGSVQVSEVYFNRDRTKAFVYGEIFCGNLCGASYDLFFEKKNGKWFLKKQIMGWVS
jgi:hypothetical protein